MLNFRHVLTRKKLGTKNEHENRQSKKQDNKAQYQQQSSKVFAELLNCIFDLFGCLLSSQQLPTIRKNNAYAEWTKAMMWTKACEADSNKNMRTIWSECMLTIRVYFQLDKSSVPNSSIKSVDCEYCKNKWQRILKYDY